MHIDKVRRIVELKKQGKSLNQISQLVFGDKAHRGTISLILTGYQINPVITPEKPVITPKIEYIEVPIKNPWTMLICGAVGFFIGAGMVWAIISFLSGKTA